MRSSRKSTTCIFAIILILLFGTILANYVYGKKNKNITRKYVQGYQSKHNKNKGSAIIQKILLGHLH
ncbi:hypothetical protein DQM11_08430 [Leuconostoc pseudomesenteroides]|jgi:hypothetical protein|nr:hypothetical protein DQM11_08430 [Leuconostoc pseudomesenteroides]